MLLYLLFIFIVGLVAGYAIGYRDRNRVARMVREDDVRVQATDIGPAPQPTDAYRSEPEIDDEEPEPEDDEPFEDVCLRPGARVLCRLSESSHTHGVLVGFGMASPQGPMIAIVSLGPASPLMPIDVDLVDPMDDDDEGGGPEIPKPTSAETKGWN